MGRPRIYTELERELLARCHVKAIQDILKQCIFGQSEECLRLLVRIYKIRKIEAKTFQERQIFMTVIKYIYIYNKRMDFKALYRENQKKYGLELEKAMTDKERDDTDIEVTGDGERNGDYENPTSADENYGEDEEGYDHSTGEDDS